MRGTKPGQPLTFPTVGVVVPAAPGWLDTAAAAIWERIAADMVADSIWRPRFADLLASYCVLRARFEADPASFSPARLTEMRQCQMQLGLTPASARGVLREPRKPAPAEQFPPKPRRTPAA